MSKNIILKAIAMVRPTSNFVYAPSKIRPSVTVSEKQFVEHYADNGKSINVSFDADGKSNPQNITAYDITTSIKGKSTIGRYIVNKK